MTLDGLLRSTCEALRRAGIPFMLTGSVATAFHGASRATMDIDFVIDPTETQLDAFVTEIEASGAYVSRAAAYDALSHRTMFNVIDGESGWKADFMIRKDRAFSEEEFRRREATEYCGMPLHVVTLEDVLLSKMEWAKLGGSARQIEDVRALLRLHRGSVDTRYVERWIDVLDVRAQWNAATSAEEL